MIIKTIYEEYFRYHNFASWLTTGEIVQTATVTVTEKDGTDVSSSMVSDVGPYDSTKVKYKIKGGAADKIYIISIKIVSSNGQKLEDKIEGVVVK